eukprot:323906-Pleurochrysis_carterae.AAC.1
MREVEDARAFVWTAQVDSDRRLRPIPRHVEVLGMDKRKPYDAPAVRARHPGIQRGGARWRGRAYKDGKKA